jgi:acyl-CoA thioester hydrolase
LFSEEITQSDAIASGARQIGLGIVPPEHMDVHGRMRAPWIIGRISDSIPGLMHAWRSRVAKAAGDIRMGAAVLEYRLIYRAWPKAGDLFEVRSALGSAKGKTHSLVHWVLDPVSGKPWATAEAVAITFDLDKRKAIETPPELIEDLKRVAPGSLAL